MFAQMNIDIEKGEEWFVISMKWVQLWKDHVGFEPKPDDEVGRGVTEEFGPNPGKIDNSDIIIDEGEKPELEEQAKKMLYLNYQLKPKLKEG